MGWNRRGGRSCTPRLRTVQEVRATAAEGRLRKNDEELNESAPGRSNPEQMIKKGDMNDERTNGMGTNVFDRSDVRVDDAENVWANRISKAEEAIRNEQKYWFAIFCWSVVVASIGGGLFVWAIIRSLQLDNHLSK